ncbi:glutathione S-transferase [Duganella callida]|uniref:Glutathione S-transferase n=1 Tax=Duganella callida TaxID=2561932 RepID=A0A4Y9SC12_9BURK|nr:glutathione S-transferase [Duganella callida]TFW17202.1 glutathione S-transferase [Duganella callida]
MKLIGMLDSPYVRRVAVSLQLLELPFEHQSLSVFRTFDQFRQINPVVKAPTLVADDGTVLMDSTLILQYAEALAAPARRLTPAAPAALLRSLHVQGLALAATDKAVQIVYEHMVRPAEKLHEPWMERVKLQLLAALDALEAELRADPPALAPRMDPGALMAAVGWHFIEQMVPDAFSVASYPLLSGFSRQAETLPAFAAAPHGDSTYRAI